MKDKKSPEILNGPVHEETIILLAPSRIQKMKDHEALVGTVIYSLGFPVLLIPQILFNCLSHLTVISR